MLDTKSTPAVSVVVPCYNQGKYLQSALLSILGQSFEDWEAVVVNDGSTDNSEAAAREIFAKFPVRRWKLVNQPNRGLAAARNAGIEASRGEFILPLDADDLLHPLYLERAVPILRENLDLGYVYVVVDCFGDEHRTWTGGEFDFSRLLRENLMACATLFRRKAWEDVGGYNTNMKYGFEDWDFWISLGEKGWFGKLLPEPLFLYRKHGVNMLQRAYREYDAWSRARLILNHPQLYAAEVVENARMSIASEAEASRRRPPSILFFHYEKPLNPAGVNGGAEMALIHMARALAKQGCRVSVAGNLPGPGGRLEGVEYINIGADYNYHRLLAERGSEFEVIISSARADVLEESLKYRNFRLRLLWLHVDVLGVVKRSPGRIEEICDAALCVSEAHLRMIARQGLNPAFLRVIHNGSDPEIFRPRPVEREPHRLIFAGALVPSKGAHNLISAFGKVREKFPDAKLDIFGSADMWSEREYIDTSANDPEATGIYFRGKVPQEELAEAFCRAALLVVPSTLERQEPYPLIPLDAQACECPALVTPSGGLPEGVADGVTGRVLPDAGAETMVKAIIELLSDTEKLREMGRAGRRRILNGYTWEAAAKKLLNLFDELESKKAERKSPPVITSPKSAKTAASIPSDSAVRTAVITTFNQKCGLATYAGYLLEYYDPDSTLILAEDSEGDREGADGPNVVRCWQRDSSDYSELFSNIRDFGAEVAHINNYPHFYQFPPFFEGLKRLRREGLKVVTSMHVTEGLNPIYHKLDDISDVVLLHMEYNRVKWAALGCDPAKAIVIPHGIPAFTPVDRNAIRKSLGLHPDMRLYLSFGFIEPHKGIAENIESLKDLKGRFPFIYIVMGGAHPRNPVGNAYIQQCLQSTVRNGLEEHVQFITGYQPFEHLWVMLNAADAVIMNYRSNKYEASGATALALSSGRPLIASAAPPFSDLGEAVLRITEMTSLAEILWLLNANEGVRNFIARNQAELVKRRSWARTAERIQGIYRKLLEGKPLKAGRAVSRMEEALV